MIRTRQKLGKYLIEGKLGEGAFAAVYKALDTIEGVRVALKVPYPMYVTEDSLEGFRREVRLVAQLSHPNILPLKNAEFIDGLFVVAFPLGQGSLADRLQLRLSVTRGLSFLEQILEAVAYAHQQRIMHCDIKPENLILFPGHRLLLTDFGIAKVARRTVHGSGSGTVGHVAPEQAMGKPSFRSDVFSIGLIGYRMFSGHWPEWPFAWPLPGLNRARRNLHPDLVGVLQRSLMLDPQQRFRDAQQMLIAFQRVRPRAILSRGSSRPRQRGQQPGSNQCDWRTVRFRQFRKQHGQSLAPLYACGGCGGPVAEPMLWCPWCGDSRKVFPEETQFPQYCPRCRRGMKLDWRYCPWCYGPGFEVGTGRQFTDARYTARCANRNCPRKDLMPFMRYCPWCRRKIGRKWKLEESPEACPLCGWGVTRDYWSNCPWCGSAL